MTQSPLLFACAHLATPQEQQRDPRYVACNAQPGQPCTWARRYDGLVDPPFHADRLEFSSMEPAGADRLGADALREAVLESGLV